MENKTKQKILLVGNPNVGKSTLFNSLCNKKQKTGNYAGVTISSHTGKYVYKNQEVEVVDLPGAYSLYANAKDEIIFTKFLNAEKQDFSGIVYIIDALSIKRGLLLLQQLQDSGLPVLLVVNQIDQTEKRGISVDFEKLSNLLNVKVLATNAKKNQGITELKDAIFENQFSITDKVSFQIPLEQKSIIKKVAEREQENNLYKIWNQLAIDADTTMADQLKAELCEADCNHLIAKRLQTQESIRRYQAIDKILAETVIKKQQFKELLTEKLDKVIVHQFWGYLIFVFVLLFIFEMVFLIAQYPMDWIDSGFAFLSDFAQTHLPEGPINSLISRGIIPGVGGIVVFAPQIGILLYFLYILEDSGYMARVVYLMDRFLRPFGLSGKSIVPLVSGTACAIPAIMSTRNIENLKERLITILVTPFMACSARLPVYSIIIGLIIPDKYFMGISYKALMLMLMYFLGFAMALFASIVLKKIIKSTTKSFLIMDMPNYKMPLFIHDLKLTLKKIWEFITGAGKIIFILSIIIWTLSYFGPSQKPQQMVEQDVHLDNSFLARMGKTIEPAIAPLGYDWKMGVGILTSFAAREVFVGTMSTLYSLQDDAPEEKVMEKMRRDLKPNGEKVFSFATGLSIMMFYAFAMQCISTIAVVVRETKSWKLAALQTVSMTAIAYIASLIVYQFFK